MVDLSLCREKYFLLLILTLFLLCVYRLIQLLVRGLFSFEEILGFGGLLSLNAFLIDGCF